MSRQILADATSALQLLCDWLVLRQILFFNMLPTSRGHLVYCIAAQVGSGLFTSLKPSFFISLPSRESILVYTGTVGSESLSRTTVRTIVL
jgi:hypothetical protein